ncbi:hypothetical protein SASPL_108879 [Salvia splendens]|uniref:RING-type domain-containing protein n=1 Tax=Salvia splendens TaxID=180675 RepID=A0A8X8YDU9_SALSN|nr:E3 ubiquitin-protein ligase DZIP3-like isoform X1 [Salvia splendens]KAG6430806.1 hypothetical protein SASPL_108879 [Salvia splendens]
MAGMLPGVEAARRRRFHQKSEPSPAISGCSTRRSSLCLYVSSHDFHLCNSTPSSQRRQIMCDESRLGTEAREAKKRLDSRLWTSETTRVKNGSEVKKNESKRLKWLKLKWRSSSLEECVVCLDEIKASPENLMKLRCGHRFHTHCLLPWLEANAHCPCCRMEITNNS